MKAPGAPLPPRFISSASRYCAIWDATTLAATIEAAFASGAYQSSVAVFFPIRLPFYYPVKRLFTANGLTAGNNFDIGLYTARGTKFWSSGSTPEVGTSVLQYVTPSPDFILPPGLWYVGFVADGNTGTQFRKTSVAASSLGGRIAGMLQQSTFPLPADLSGTSTHSTANYPLVGLTMTSAGF